MADPIDLLRMKITYPKDVLLDDALEALDAISLREMEARERIGWALFNLTKGNTRAANVLLRKAYKSLAGREWDG